MREGFVDAVYRIVINLVSGFRYWGETQHVLVMEKVCGRSVRVVSLDIQCKIYSAPSIIN